MLEKMTEQGFHLLRRERPVVPAQKLTAQSIFDGAKRAAAAFGTFMVHGIPTHEAPQTAQSWNDYDLKPTRATTAKMPIYANEPGAEALVENQIDQPIHKYKRRKYSPVASLGDKVAVAAVEVFNSGAETVKEFTAPFQRPDPDVIYDNVFELPQNKGLFPDFQAVQTYAPLKQHLKEAPKQIKSALRERLVYTLAIILRKRDDLNYLYLRNERQYSPREIQFMFLRDQGEALEYLIAVAGFVPSMVLAGLTLVPLLYQITHK